MLFVEAFAVVAVLVVAWVTFGALVFFLVAVAWGAAVLGAAAWGEPAAAHAPMARAAHKATGDARFRKSPV